MGASSQGTNVETCHKLSSMLVGRNKKHDNNPVIPATAKQIAAAVRLRLTDNHDIASQTTGIAHNEIYVK